MGNPIIAIVDSFGIVREAYAYSLKDAGLNVPLVCKDWDDFKRKSTRLKPDICLVNVDAPIYKHLCLAELKRQWPGMKIVGYTVDDRPRTEHVAEVDIFLPFHTSVERLCTQIKFAFTPFLDNTIAAVA